MAEVSIKHYWEPTPARLRKVGDSILWVSLALQPLTLTLPITDNQRLWINFGISGLGIAGKFITNLFKDE
jgi:hypothetical protein